MDFNSLPDIALIQDIADKLPYVGKDQVKRARLPIYSARGKDTVSLAAYQKRVPLVLYGIKADGTVEKISNATAGYEVSGTVGVTANDDSRAVLNTTVGQTLLTGSFYLLWGLNAQVEVQWTTNTYTSAYMLYVNEPDVVTYERVKFTTKAAQTTYDDTMLRGMDIGLVLYGQGPLDISQWSLNASQLTINVGDLGVEADLPLLVFPSTAFTYITTTIANTAVYTNQALQGITIAAVIVGQEILDSSAYTFLGGVLTLQSVPNAGLQLIVISTNDVDVMFTTTAALNTYTSTALNGAFIDFVILGQAVLSPSQYSLTGKTITLNTGGDVPANEKLLIWKIN